MQIIMHNPNRIFLDEKLENTAESILLLKPSLPQKKILITVKHKMLTTTFKEVKKEK